MDPELTQTWDLVRQAQGGNGPALNRLFARYYERVRRCVRARLGSKLRAQLETVDILQPAFAKAFQNFDRFEMRDEASLLHWLAEYAHGQLHDAVERENAQKRRPPKAPLQLDAGGSDDSRAIAVPSPVTGPVDAAARDEHEAAVEQCLDEMPEHYRMVIVLRDYDGLDWHAVAAGLHKNTDSAARELHRRALEDLAVRLTRRGIGPAAD